MATKVTLRQKAISKNRHSLYLDFYPPIAHPETGEPTRREFLGMYLTDKPKNPLEKQGNKDAIQIAEQIRQQRENLLNKPEIYSGYEKEQLRLKELGEQNFVAYFKSLTDKRNASNYDNWVSAFQYLDTFTNGSLKFADITEMWCNDFKEFLLTTQSNKSTKATLAPNTAVSYFNKVKAALKQAYKDGILSIDVNAKIAPIPLTDTRRNKLTIQELNSLANTDCNKPLLKKAALFSALTGLRFSDIAKLVWAEVEFIEGNGYYLNFTQQKTKGVETQPISEQAYSLLGEPKEPSQKVFEGLTYSAHENKHLYQWIGAAGITKDITFHCFRHTYATLLLAADTDIYTVSKMLGHKTVAITQRYAEVMSQAKRDTTNKIKLDICNDNR